MPNTGCNRDHTTIKRVFTWDFQNKNINSQNSCQRLAGGIPDAPKVGPVCTRRYPFMSPSFLVSPSTYLQHEHTSDLIAQ